MATPRSPSSLRKSLTCLGILAASVAGGAGAAILDTCGPFTDVPVAICPFVTELYVLGITAGTSPTTFSPDSPLTRGQAAVFSAKAFDQSLARSSRRAALGQWWTTTPHYDLGLGITQVPLTPTEGIASDGTDVWAVSGNEFGQGTISRIRASDGRYLESWSLDDAYAVLPAMGRIFVSTYAGTSQQGLFVIDPAQPPAPLSSVLGPIDSGFTGLAFDGARIWAAGFGPAAIITPSAAPPWPVTVTPGGTAVIDVLFDGSNVWAVDAGTSPGKLEKLDASGNVLQTVPVGADPRFATFDGANIWVPNLGDKTVTVVQASTGVVLATLVLGKNDAPWSAAFDGQRVLVTSLSAKLWLFKAADLSTIGSFDLVSGNSPYRVCSDGTQFFLSLLGGGTSWVARF